MDEDLSRFCCQNSDCPDHGQRGLGNLTVCHRYGKHKHIRLLYCRTCRYRFSERRGTPLFGSQLPQDKAVAVFRHLADRNGVRVTARLVGVAPNTVVRYSRLAGGHARALHDEFVAFSPRTDEIQFDEKWSFVFKKQEHCDPDEPADANHGDWWDHVAYDPEHRLVLCVVPGARDVECVEEVVSEAKQRTGGRVLRVITSDAYPAYEAAILAAYGQDRTTTPSGRESRRMVPGKVPPPGLNYATVEKRREKGRVVEILTRVVFGTMAAVLAALGQSSVSRWINTSFLERQNATDRHHNTRKVRKTYTFSKDWRVHEAMTYFTMYSYNFCWPVRTLAERDDWGHLRRRTPAMAAGLADHVWSMREWVTMPCVQRR